MLTQTDLTTGLAQDEENTGRTFDVVHNYHVNGQLFPTTAERAIAEQPGHNRLLFMNWKPSTTDTWQQVADGAIDSRIDAEAEYLKQTFRHPFFLTIWHEPENDVDATQGSGRTAADYAAMYRHVVQRLRTDGVTWAITVMVYMGYDPWALKPWFSALWPGNDVVDWVGIDPYASGDATGYLSGDFDRLVNRPDSSFSGFYQWITTEFPDKPIMISEWGVKESTSNPDGKAEFFRTVESQIGNFPAVKALIYFDTPMAPTPDIGDTRPDSSPQSLAAFSALGTSAAIQGPGIHYTDTGVAAGQ